MIRALAYPASVVMAVIATPSFADWGGVAVNSDGIGWGYSAGWDSKSAAHARAMQYCREYSNNPDNCSVVITTQRCAAVVRGKKGSAAKLFVVGARNRDAAEQGAMAQCREAGASCETRRKFCANDL